MMLNRVSLNTIGLNRIGLNRIGKPSRGSSDRPYIDPEVLASLKAVCICYGKSNDDPDRAIVKNLVDPDNPFVISNAAFKLNSGFGKYEVDFTVYNNQNVLVSPNKIVSIAGREFISLLPYTELSKTISSYKIKVTGLIGELSYWYRNQDGSESRIIITKDGIYQLSTCYNVENGQGSSVGFNGYSESSCTIEQIPSFEGAFVTDGIDDLITSTKTVQEMLGGSNEITVVSMIHQIDGNVNYTNGYTNYIRHGGGFIRNSVSGINGKGFNKTGIYGYTSTQLDSSNMGLGNVINNILGDKDDYSFERSSTYTLDDAKYSVQNFVNANNQPSNEGSSVAWYWTIIANKVLTTDQINQVIAYFNLDRTLKPDILCNTIKQGITNENHAEFGDKLIDFSGNGRDIQLNNIAWKGDSGIGKYEVDFLDSSIWNSSNSTITSSKIDCKNAISHIMLLYYSVGGKEYPDIPSFKVIKTGADIDYSYIDETGSPKSVKIVDGVNILPASHNTLYSGSGRFCGFGNPGMGNSVTITQIPSHAGALCLDGVNDFGKVTGMPIYKDYTFIAEREFLSTPDDFVNAGSIVSKMHEIGKGSFIFETFTKTQAREVSFSSTTDFDNPNTERIISYQSKYSYNGKALTAGQVEDRDVMWLGTIRDNDTRFVNAAIYSLMLFPYSMSEFLIERQLKKHKLGTLYPDMVEFRPIVPKDDRIESINYYNENNRAYIGNYYPIGSNTSISFKMVKPYKIISIKVNGANTVYNYNNAFNFKMPSKSPQKFTNLNIVVDTSIILFNPTINSNAIFEVGNEQNMTELFTQLNNGEIDGIILYMQGDKAVLPNNWIDKNTKVRAIIYCLDTVSEEDIHFTVDGKTKYCYSAIEDGLAAFGIMDEDSQEEQYMTNVLTANTIDIQLDQYIRYEDIVQPYPVLLRFNDENGNEVSWGGKFRVGSTITRIGSISDPESNLLNGLYSVSGLSLNGKAVTSSTSIVEKQMVFRTTATWLLDNNEPKVILSPSRLRIPNSSYKLLGYIPDISGHGNHGILHNSDYAEGSGVNEDGSYQLDGVNDHVTIPTTVGGKQMLMKVNWQKSPTLLYDQRASGSFAVLTTKEDDAVNSRIAYQGHNPNGKTYIDGIENNNIETYTLKDITHNITIANSSLGGIIVPVIGCNTGKTSSFAKMSLYDFMLFDEISTDEEILNLNKYIGIEPKVTIPSYYWDAYGKTDTDTDRDAIKQRGIAVGDYDLTNNNFAYDKMSGYGGYEFAKFTSSEWYKGNAETGIKVISISDYSITLKKLGDSSWEFRNYTYRANNESGNLNRDLILKVRSNKAISIGWDFKYKLVDDTTERTIFGRPGTLEPNQDTEITLPYKSSEEIAALGDVVAGSAYYLLYFRNNDLSVGEEYTVEMLPLYPNGLVYDGVTDYSDNASIPALTDYTYILKREFLNKIAGSASIYKGEFLANGGRAFIADYAIPDGSLYGFSYGGQAKVNSLNTDKIIYGTKTSVNGSSITPNTNIDTAGLTMGKFDSYRKMVFYKLILYPKTIPLLQINFLKNLMERDEIIDLNNKIFIRE